MRVTGIIIFLLFFAGLSAVASAKTHGTAASDCEVLYDLIARSLPSEKMKSGDLVTDGLSTGFFASAKGLLLRIKKDVNDEKWASQSSEKKSPLLFNLEGGQGWRYHSNDIGAKTYTSDEYHHLAEKIKILEELFMSDKNIVFSYLDRNRLISELINTRNFVPDQKVMERRYLLGVLGGILIGALGGPITAISANPHNHSESPYFKITEEAKASSAKNLTNHLDLVNQTLKERGDSIEDIERIIKEHKRRLRRAEKEGSSPLFGSRPIDYRKVLLTLKGDPQEELFFLATQNPKRFNYKTYWDEYRDYMQNPRSQITWDSSIYKTFTVEELKVKENTNAEEKDHPRKVIAGSILGGAMLGLLTGGVTASKPGRNLATFLRNLVSPGKAFDPLLQELRDFIKSKNEGISWYWIGRNVGNEHVDIIVERSGWNIRLLGLRYKASLDYQKPPPPPPSPVEVVKEELAAVVAKPIEPKINPENRFLVLESLEKKLREQYLVLDFKRENQARLKKLFSDAFRLIEYENDLNQFQERAKKIKKFEDIAELEKYLRYLEAKKKNGEKAA